MTKDTDYGFKRILAVARELESEPVVKVGFVADSEVALYAAANEFGTDNAGRGNKTRIPERSFMRSTFDEKNAEWRGITDRFHGAILRGAETVKGALNKIGLLQKSAYMAKINSNIQPENAESTIARKGSSKTLIDTGRMLNAMQIKVEKGVL